MERLHRKYFDDALCFCAGWMGWSFKQALNEDLNYIEAARIGRMEMLRSIFGSSEDQAQSQERAVPVSRPERIDVNKNREVYSPPPADLPPLTPDIFDRLFGNNGQ